MRFSVLMAHYNNAKFLEAAIRSVLAHTFTDWEIVLIDDASTDNFEEIINRYTTNDSIKVFRNEKNMGCAYTKWRCAKEARGDIAAFLDPDDTLHPDALYIMHNAHQEHSSCSIIHSTHFVCDENLSVLRIANYPKALPPDTPYLLVNDGSIHHFASFKMDSYNRTAGIVPHRAIPKAIDQDLYYLLEEEGNVLFINQPLYYYRIHKGSISNAGNEALTMQAHYAIVEEACLRRMKKLKIIGTTEAKKQIKRYRTRYYKIRIFNSFRRKKWLRFSSSLLVFPFVGGFNNLVSYFKKLPKEGNALIKKSFTTNYDVLKTDN